jgi:DNA-binding CsgD family transcriptional regulator
MASTKFLKETDVRAMVRLLGEVAANSGGHAEKKRQLMEGLCTLIGADYWVWAMCAQMEPGKQPVYVMAHNGGFAEGQFGRLIRAVEHPDMCVLSAPFAAELARKRTHLTRLDRQMDPEGNISKNDVGALWREAGIGPILLSYRPLDGGLLSSIAIYRKAESAAFGQRESRIAHIVLSEVPWLHLQGWPKKEAATVPLLSRRPIAVLHLLIDGMSRKEISTCLKISEHTVNDYVKVVFRHFGVNSQKQLVRRFHKGDGGDLR